MLSTESFESLRALWTAGDGSPLEVVVRFTKADGQVRDAWCVVRAEGSERRVVVRPLAKRSKSH